MGSPNLLCSPSHFTRTPQVSHVLAALQAGNRGTQACITAASAVSGIIADLDTTIMFATAGTLNRENSETFADHRYPGTLSSLCSARDRGFKLCPMVSLSKLGLCWLYFPELPFVHGKTRIRSLSVPQGPCVQ